MCPKSRVLNYSNIKKSLIIKSMRSLILAIFSYIIFYEILIKNLLKDKKKPYKSMRSLILIIISSLI